MGTTTGFRDIARKDVPLADALVRLRHWREFHEPAPEEHLRQQGARCMDCGVPFCQSDHGCPIDNLIPEWNDLVYKGRWRVAYERLARTNPFPEFTGRVCPAPCEGACVLGVTSPPVAIKNIENAIIDRAFEERWVRLHPPAMRTGRHIAVVGSGPAGLAAAWALNQRGHRVLVFEREDRAGGLLTYGIPNMKLDKVRVVERRLAILAAEGVEFRCGTEIGRDVEANDLINDFDAVLLCTGSTVPRDLSIPGRDLRGIHFAMPFLTENTRALLAGPGDGNAAPVPGADLQGSPLPIAHPLNAADRQVFVIGGGDTGTDCVATALRQNCAGVMNLELLDRPPELRANDNPWPQWPRIFRIDYGHAEAAAKHGADPRAFAVLTRRFLDDGNGNVAGIETVRVNWVGDSPGSADRPRLQEIPGSEQTFAADLVLLALGFIGPEKTLAEQFGLARDERSNFAAGTNGEDAYFTSVPGVFAAGDCRRGQSLVVWAMQEGLAAASSVDAWLMRKPPEVSSSTFA